jgi:hypothetical protein
MNRWSAGMDLTGEAATDEDSNPLDVILIPGKVRGPFIFARMHSNDHKQNFCVTPLSFPCDCVY